MKKNTAMRPAGPLALVLLAAAAAFPSGARADDVPNPFSDVPATAQKKRAAAVPAADPQKPMLSPMTGPPGSPSARTPDPAPGGYGTPYGPPPGTPGIAPSGGDTGRPDTAYNQPPRAAPLPPVQTLPPPDERSRGVERGDLTPVMAADGSGLPLDLWTGLDVKAVETLVSRLEIPPRSPALHALWHRLITSEANPPKGGDKPQMFEALRVEALFRSGLLKEAAARLEKAPDAATDPMLAPLYARGEIALGHRDTGCAAAKSVSAAKAQLPKPMKLEATLMLGLCAAAATGPAAAGLAADLARDEGLADAPGVAILEAIAGGHPPRLPAGKPLGIIDYRLYELTKAPLPHDIAERATPSLLALLASETAVPLPTRLSAAEAALRLNAIAPQALADLYRSSARGEARAEPGGEPTDAPGSAPAQRNGRGDALARAQLFAAAETERTPLKKVRQIRAFLDESRRAGLYLPALQMMSRAVADIQPVPEIGWFAETATEVMLAAGKYDRARAWAGFGGGLDRPGSAASGNAPVAPFTHWLALADIADPNLPKGERGAHLTALEEQALRGRFTPDQLHRVATVLDALDYNVPMRLWEAASRSPQPTSGHLPPTGVLTELQDASKKKEFGRTVLLAMDALGPHGAEGAHMIALGDSIRALRRAGLDTDARRLGLEALFAAWPRTAAN